jgi:hypothetical protein
MVIGFMFLFICIFALVGAKKTKDIENEQPTTIEHQRFTLVANNNEQEEITEENTASEETTPMEVVNTNEFANGEKSKPNVMAIIFPSCIILAFIVEFVVIIMQRKKIIKANDELGRLKSEEQPLNIEKDILNAENENKEENE